MVFHKIFIPVIIFILPLQFTLPPTKSVNNFYLYRRLVERKIKGKLSYLYHTEKGIDLQVEIDKCWESLYKRYSEILGCEKGVKLTKLINKAVSELEKNIS